MMIDVIIVNIFANCTEYNNNNKNDQVNVSCYTRFFPKIFLEIQKCSFFLHMCDLQPGVQSVTLKKLT